MVNVTLTGLTPGLEEAAGMEHGHKESLEEPCDRAEILREAVKRRLIYDEVSPSKRLGNKIVWNKSLKNKPDHFSRDNCIFYEFRKQCRRCEDLWYSVESHGGDMHKFTNTRYVAIERVIQWIFEIFLFFSGAFR